LKVNLSASQDYPDQFYRILVDRTRALFRIRKQKLAADCTAKILVSIVSYALWSVMATSRE
jgi:hypothetical protein